MRGGTEYRLRKAIAERAGCDEGETCEIACAYCGSPGEVDWTQRLPRFFEFVAGIKFSMQLDHVIPECRNGPTSVDNTVISCRACNRAKGTHAFGDRRFQEWLRERRLETVEREMKALGHEVRLLEVFAS